MIYGDGEQTRDFVYVKDVVRANIMASRSGRGVFNIAGGRRTNLNQLAFLIGKILGAVSDQSTEIRGLETLEILWRISTGLEKLATGLRPVWRMGSPRR